MKSELVCSVYIFSEKRFLLLHHCKLNTWIAPGGHVENNEAPHLTAIREAKEETGLEIALLRLNAIELNYPNAKTLPSAYMTISHFVNFPCVHEHINFVYLGYPVGGMLKKNEEANQLQWFSKEEIEKMNKTAILPDSLDMVNHLFSKPELFASVLKAEKFK